MRKPSTDNHFGDLPYDEIILTDPVTGEEYVDDDEDPEPDTKT